MKFVTLFCLFTLAACRPDLRSYSVPDRSNESDEADVAQILRDDRVHPEDGKYSFDIETEDGIKRSESGSRLDIENNPTGQQGVVSFTFPNGEEFELKFVANEKGFQPESAWLPVAPEFPHPIPQFVLDQIEKAAREDSEEAKVAKTAKSAPRSSYRPPRPTYSFDSDESDEK